MQVTDVSPVYVAGFTIPIEIETHPLQVAHQLGQYLGDEPRIIIRGDVPPQMMAETVLHEVLHAIGGLYLESQEISEHMISMLAQGLLQVIQDNPEFTKYVSGGFEEEPIDCKGGDACQACVSCKSTDPTVT